MRISPIAVALAALAAPAASQTVELGTVLDYQRGDYGTDERIETATVTNRIEIESGRVTLSASLPWQRIEGPGNAVGGGGPLGLPILIDPTRPAARSVRQGMGDLRIGAAYTPVRDLGGVALTVSGQVKLPTASRRNGLGTGETDYALGAEASVRIGALTPFTALAYTVAGDPEAFDLRNSVSAKAGAAIGLSDRVRGHVAYGYARGLSPAVPDEQHLSTGLETTLGRRLSLGIHGSAGLSDGPADVGAGLSLGIRM